MKTLPVAEVRTHFSSLIKEVEAGHEIGVSFGRKKEMVAVIIPFARYTKGKKRRLGTLEGKGSVTFSEDWAMTDEDLLNS